MKKIQVLVADNKLLRETLKIFINSDARFEVPGTCSSAAEAVVLSKQLRPDIVLMNIPVFPLAAANAVKQITMERNCQVIALSIHTSTSYIKKLITAGASGYLSMNASTEEMFEALVTVYAGKKYFCTEIRHRIAEAINEPAKPLPGLFRINHNEIIVMSLLKKGLSSKEIATALAIAPKTVALHRHRILKKLKVQNVPALINFLSKNPDAENTS